MSEKAFTQCVLDVNGLTPQTMDDASITTKLAVIKRVKTPFSEGESMAIKALPMPSLEVCWRSSRRAPHAAFDDDDRSLHLPPWQVTRPHRSRWLSDLFAQPLT